MSEQEMMKNKIKNNNKKTIEKFQTLVMLGS